MKKTSVAELIAGLQKRDWRALGKAITIVENWYEGRNELLEYAYRTCNNNCLILGITGAGGAGKSTLIDSILQAYSRKGLRVGVLAVDPSSSYTGGAVLGDRIRMTRHTSEQDFFIRSFGSRGTLGGISRGCKDVLYLYKSFGFDIIIIESLGVGQEETDITNFVDVTAVVLAPGNGDYIQLSKAGTQEIADIFVVNKADRSEADALYRQLLSTFDFLPEENRPIIVKTTARDQIGTEELANLFLTVGKQLVPNRKNKEKIRIMNEIQSNALQIFEPVLETQINIIIEDVMDGRLSPFEAAKQLGDRILFV